MATANILPTSYAEKITSQLRRPEPPPKGLDPLTAGNDVLIKHGLPLRPNKANCPKQYALWERLMARPLTFIEPEFEVVEVVPGPLPKLVYPRGESYKESPTWSGAVNTTLKCKDMFRHITVSWVIPLAYPPMSQWDGKAWKRSDNTPKYECGVWIGIDGHHTSHDVVQAGTAQTCVITSNEKLVQTACAWFEWYPEDQVTFSNFPVRSGDLVTCIVECPDPAVDPGLNCTFQTTGTPTARFIMINQSACTYTSVSRNHPVTDSKYEFKGDMAEWIIEGHIKNNHSTMPYLGATFMYDCLAVTRRSEERDLEDALLINMVVDSQTLSRAVRENKSVLGIFSEPRDEARFLKVKQ